MRLPWQKSTDQQIAAFWTWFQANAKTVGANLTSPGGAKPIGDRLKAIDRGLGFGALYAGEDDVSCLEISASGVSSLIPLVQKIVAAAPEIPGWKVVAFRQPMEFDDGFRTQAGEFDAKSIYWRGQGSHDGKLDLAIYVSTPYPLTEMQLAEVAFIALDHTVGEYSVMTQIGAVDFKPYTPDIPGLLPLTDLPHHLETTRP